MVTNITDHAEAEAILMHCECGKKNAYLWDDRNLLDMYVQIKCQ